MVAVAPGFEMPAMAIKLKPVERTVRNLEITRCVQWTPCGAPVDDVEHTAVTHCGDRLPCVMSHHPLDTIRDPMSKLAQRLARLEIVVQITRLIVRIGQRIPLGPLRGGHALKNPIMALAELRQQLHFLILSLCQHPGCFYRSYQITAVDRMEALMRRVEGHRKSLCPPNLVKRNIGVPLYALLHIPVGFAVADDADPGLDGFGCVIHLNHLHLNC